MTKVKTLVARGAGKKRGRRAVRARGGAGRTPQAALAALAHDIRTPLGGILALSELLAASEIGERERDWALTIKSTTEYLASLTTLLVDAVKAETVGLVLRRDVFDPHKLADAVATLLVARAQAKDLQVETTIDPNLPLVVVGDPVRLRAALENLADNAVKFTDAGRIAFAVAAGRAPRGRIRLTFSLTDTGVGLGRAEISRLFRPFSQAGEEVARRYGGAGLGLVSVKRLAEAMGGGLTLTSVPGKGSTFELSVVVGKTQSGADEAAAAAAGPPPGATGPPRRLRVLCAEDNPFGRVVLNTILTELGHRTDFVSSGEGAVEHVARGDFDAVLMDVTLAGVDGLEAARRMRALPPERARIPIIGISGRSTAADAAAARAAGMDAYLTKPISGRALAEILTALTAPKDSVNGG